jgi:hypothetical protein
MKEAAPMSLFEQTNPIDSRGVVAAQAGIQTVFTKQSQMSVLCPLPTKRSLSKQTQFFLCDLLCRSVAKNAKQSQYIAFSAQKQGLQKKQTQIKPKIERPVLCLSKEAKSSFCQNKANRNAVAMKKPNEPNSFSVSVACPELISGCRSVAKNAKQSQISAFSNQNQRFAKKQTQSSQRL